MKNAARDPRYRQLEGLQAHQLVGERIPTLEKNNAEFGESLDTVNDMRIASLLRATPDYPRYKFAIAAALNECDDIPSFVPQRRWAQHANLNSVEVGVRNPQDQDAITRSGQEIADFFFTTPNNIDSPNLPAPLMPFWLDAEVKSVQWVTTGEAPLASLRWLIEGRGLRMDEWAMDVPRAGRLSFYRFISTRFSNEDGSLLLEQGLDLVRVLQTLLKLDGELGSMFANLSQTSLNEALAKAWRGTDVESDGAAHAKVCAYLKDASLRALR